MGEIKYIYFPTVLKPILMSRRRQDPPFSPNIFPRCEIRKELWSNIVGLMILKCSLRALGLQNFLLGKRPKVYFKSHLRKHLLINRLLQGCICQYLFKASRQEIITHSWVCPQSFSNCRWSLQQFIIIVLLPQFVKLLTKPNIHIHWLTWANLDSPWGVT